MKDKNYLYLLLLIILSLLGYNVTNQGSPNKPLDTESTISSHVDLSDLSQTGHFTEGGLDHIFYGSINQDGQATGFHYEGLSDQAQVIESTRSYPDSEGVYRARVTIKNKDKKAFSTFFPKDWSPQEVVDAINQAYDGRSYISGNTYEGQGKGLPIQMYLSQDDLIISAFPIYQP